MTSSMLTSRVALGAAGLFFRRNSAGPDIPPLCRHAAIPANGDDHHARLSGVGPADFKLRVVNSPNGKKMLSCRQPSTPPNGAGSITPSRRCYG